jgi:serine/threonine protein kinase
MSQPNHSEAPSVPTEDDPRVTGALREYLAALEAGRRPNRDAFLARHADVADALAEGLDGLEFIHDAASHLHSATEGIATGPGLQPEAPLGDFRLVREVGRGGMGVVYEAVQMSLGRRVALKVLPFAASLDARQLQRFKNEAHAAAQLHHTNIVPVYYVGCERGVHFYAMQFIEGRSLAALVRELQRWTRSEKEMSPPPTPPGRAIDGDDPTTPYLPAPSPDVPTTEPPTKPAAFSTEPATRSPAHFRAVANLGLQAATALEYAHQQGVIHRDVKPANLLLDGRGNLWVTDFGLARVQGDVSLTHTGDVLGTLRYSSPEQARGGAGAVDHRTDVYSLGVSLYELLALRPAFSSRDRQELLHQVAFEEPIPPRRLHRAVPVELETIVLKAMAKLPEERYATAGELADDLERFLKDEPIRAKRPTLMQRTKKWARRHRPVVTSAVISTFVLLFLAVVGLAANYRLIQNEKNQTDAALQEEAEQRRIAERERDTAQRHLHRSYALLSQQAWERGEIERLRTLLGHQLPRAGREDLRGWEWYFLRSLLQRDLLTLGGHQDKVFAVAYSPDGKWLATAGADQAVRVWEAVSGKLLYVLKGHTDNVRGLTFHPKTERLASAGEDGKVKIWDLCKGQEISTLTPAGKPTWLRTAAYSPDGRRLASSNSTGTVFIWDSETNKEVATLRAGYFAILGLAYVPDGRSLVTADLDGRVKVWDVATGKAAVTCNGFSNARALAVSPDGTRFALGSDEGPVEIREIATGKRLFQLASEGEAGQCLAYSPDGRFLAAAGPQTVRLYDAQTSLPLRTYRGANWVAAFSPDSKRLATGGEENTVKVWDAEEGSGSPDHSFQGSQFRFR